MDAEEHLAAFVASFVAPERRDRWRELLARRGPNTFRNSAKLMGALDPRYCARVDRPSGEHLDRRGVFYDFWDEPAAKTLAEAATDAYYEDAIFSIEPGRLAYHFSHEGWIWLCRR